MTVEEIKAAVANLWAEELLEIERMEAEAEQEASKVQDRRSALVAEIEAGEAELGSLRAELAELPNRLTVASLRGDDAEENRVRSRFNELEGRLPVLADQLEESRAELAAVPDPDEIRSAGRRRAEALHDDLVDKASAEADAIGEALTERGSRLGLYKSWTLYA